MRSYAFDTVCWLAAFAKNCFGMEVNMEDILWKRIGMIWNRNGLRWP